MREVLDKLWELQTVMTELAQKEAALNSMPADYAAVEREYRSMRDDIASMETRTEALAKEQRAIDRQLQDEQEHMKKFQGQLMQVKNPAQYSAALKEIDTKRKQIKEIEDSLLAKMKEQEELQALLEAKKTAFGPLEQQHSEAYEAWQHSLSDLRVDVERVKARAASIQPAIPDNLRREFDKLRTHKQGVGVALVMNESCTSCRVKVRPQSLQQLKRGELVFCDGCRRILYLEGVPV